MAKRIVQKSGISAQDTFTHGFFSGVAGFTTLNMGKKPSKNHETLELMATEDWAHCPEISFSLLSIT